MYVTLSPPTDLVLEIAPTGYMFITWLVNGSSMHSFERVELENNSKRFTLSNTSSDDIGIYEADVHTLNGSVLTANFYVQTFRKAYSSPYSYNINFYDNLYLLIKVLLMWSFQPLNKVQE